MGVTLLFFQILMSVAHDLARTEVHVTTMRAPTHVSVPMAGQDPIVKRVLIIITFSPFFHSANLKQTTF